MSIERLKTRSQPSQ